MNRKDKKNLVWGSGNNHSLAPMRQCLAKTVPLARNIKQEDIAKTALYLLSNLASGVTGNLILVDTDASLMVN